MGFWSGRACDSCVPTEQDIETRRQWTGIDNKLKVEGNNLIKTVPELYVDLSSIAKGYRVDAVADYLESQNIRNYMVDVGGEVRTQGINGKGKTVAHCGLKTIVTGAEPVCTGDH